VITGAVLVAAGAILYFLIPHSAAPPKTMQAPAFPLH
jgi:hypothetical protein